MLQGTPEMVRQKSRELIAAAGSGGGLILSPGARFCETRRRRTCGQLTVDFPHCQFGGPVQPVADLLVGRAAIRLERADQIRAE